MVDEKLEEYLAWERLQDRPAFARTETRHTKLKRRLDCGHVVDGTEPYRYHVHKDRGREGVVQETACELCARRDNAY